MDKDGTIVGGWGATRTSRWATWQRDRKNSGGGSDGNDEDTHLADT